MSKLTNCDICGNPVNIGEWPWCPHGVGTNGHGAFTPGEFEMAGTDPVHFGNWGEKLKYMDRNGIEPHKFRESAPGSKIFSR